jgi:hypothetical protein
MKSLLKRLPILVMICFLFTSCESTGVGFFGWIWGALGYAAIGALAYYISAQHNWWIDSHDENVYRVLAVPFRWSEGFGNWLSCTFKGCSKSVNFGTTWLIMLFIAVMAIVFLFIGVYVEGRIGFYIAGLCAVVSLLCMFNRTYFDRDKKELKESIKEGAGLVESLSVGQYISFLLFDFVFILILIVVIFVMIAVALGMANNNSSSSSSSSSRDSGSDYGNDRLEQSSSSNSKSDSAKHMYTVNFKYPSGSAIKDECHYFEFEHQPTISDIKAKIRSMGWGIDVDKVDVYCLRFGHGLPNATANHPDNLL